MVRRFTLLCLVASNAGCGGASASDPGEPASSVDSAGVHIITYSRESLLSLPVYAAAATPDWVIGEVDGPAGHVLHRVTVVASGPAGALLVADEEGRVLRLYNSEGRFLAEHGRRGEGPGEYRRIAGIQLLPGDSVALYDPVAGRISIVDPDLRYVRSLAFEGRPRINRNVVPVAPGIAVAFAMAEPDPVAYDVGTHVLELPQALVRMRTGTRSVAIDTVTVLAGDTWIYRIWEGERYGRTVKMVTGGQQSACGFRAMLAPHADGFSFAHGGTGEVKFFSPDGRLLRSIRLEATPRRREASEEALCEQWDSRGVGGIQNMLPQREFVHSVIRRMMADSDGNTWVLMDTVVFRGASWLVLDPEGKPLRWQQVPNSHAEVTYIGTDHLLLHTRDEFGVERLQKHRIRRND